MKNADILLSGARIVSLNEKEEIIERGSIAIIDDKIVEMGPQSVIDEKYKNALKIIDCKGKVVMPGLINCHCHTCQQLARGIADEVNTLTWLARTVSFEAQMDEEDVYFSSLLACAEMIKSGTTTFIEAGANPLYDDQVGNAILKTGIRGILTRSITEVTDPDWETPENFLESHEQSLERLERLYKKWHGVDNGRIKVWSFFRQQWNLSDSLLKDIFELANKYDAGVHGHLSTRNYGQIELLHSLGLLGPNMLFTHAVKFTPREIELMKEYDVKITHCCEASMHGVYGAVEIGQFPEMLEKGIVVSIGCDGAANNNNLDMIEEMRSVSLAHKEHRLDPECMDAKTVLKMATNLGAKALLMEDQIGSLEVGKKADIIILDFQQPHLIPAYDVCSNLVYCAKGSDVETVIIDGKVVMENKKLTLIDENAIMQGAIRCEEKLREKFFELRKIKLK